MGGKTKICSMIKALIFDLGGVLFTNGTKSFCHYIAGTYSLHYERVLELFSEGKIGSAYREGKMSHSEFWRIVKKELSLTDDAENLENEWINRYELIADTRDIILDLAKKYKVYFLSDNVKERVEKINNIHNFLSWFEGGVFSHEVGVRKPDLKIYEITLQKIGVKPEETVFIDDKETNLPPARKLGVHALLFKTPEQLREDLRGLGIFR